METQVSITCQGPDWQEVADFIISRDTVLNFIGVEETSELGNKHLQAMGTVTGNPSSLTKALKRKWPECKPSCSKISKTWEATKIYTLKYVDTVEGTPVGVISKGIYQDALTEFCRCWEADERTQMGMYRKLCRGMGSRSIIADTIITDCNRHKRTLPSISQLQRFIWTIATENDPDNNIDLLIKKLNL